MKNYDQKTNVTGYSSDLEQDTLSNEGAQQPAPPFHLTGVPPLQRSPASAATAQNPSAAPQGATKAAASSPTNTDSAEQDPFAKLVHDLIKDNLLSKEKLDEISKAIGEKAADFVKEQMESSDSKANFLQKTSNAKILQVLSGDIKKGVDQMLASPTGEAVKAKILETVKTNPTVALAAVVAGLAVAYAANVPLKGEKTFKLGKGFEAEIGGDMGTAQELAFKQIKGGVSYTSTYFKSGISAEYKDDAFSMESMAKFGSKDYNTAATVTLSTDNKAEFKLDTHLNNIDISGGLKLDTSQLSLMKGFGRFKIGDKKEYFQTELTLGPDGKVDLSLGGQVTLIPKRLDVKGSLSYGFADSSVKAEGSASITVVPKVFSIDIYGKGSGNKDTGFGGEVGGFLTFTLPEPGMKKKK